MYALKVGIVAAILFAIKVAEVLVLGWFFSKK